MAGVVQLDKALRCKAPLEAIGYDYLAHADIADSKPLWFLLDTGATASYLDVRPATALGLNQDDSAEDSVGCLYRKRLQLKLETEER